MHLVDSLGNNERLEYITLFHEQACTMAAETYARIDYSMGVSLVTSGPGGTNAITGVAAAWLESTPCLVISGQAKSSDLKRDTGVRQRGNQEIGIVDIVSSITKYAVIVENPMEIRYHLERACYEAKEGRQGPVWLDIPLDVQAAEIDPEKLKGFQPPAAPFTLEEKELDFVIEKLQQAKRPVIIAGQGIERNNGKDRFRELVSLLNIPILTSWLGVELLEYDHPCNMGKPGMVAARYSNYTMQNADLILAIGTRLDPAMIGYDAEGFAPGAKKIIVDIDKAEIDKFVFPIEQKIVSDASLFIEKLSDYIRRNKIILKTDSWNQQCRIWKEKYPVIKEEFKKASTAVNPYYFMEVLSEEAKDDELIIPGSSGAGIDVFWLSIQNKRKQRMLATGSLGSMGYGIPAAIGACIASGKRTLCIEGDGSLQLNIQELASIKGRNLPIKIFVFNNGGYLSIMNMQKNHFKGHFVGAEKSSNLYIPDITKVAEAYGFQTYEIRNHVKMREIIQQTMNEPGPVLCNVFMESDCQIQPKVMSRVDEKTGSMLSGRLEDLWPFLEEQEQSENILNCNGK